jgi:hypothetical protein
MCGQSEHSNKLHATYVYNVVHIKERSFTIFPCGIWDVKACTVHCFILRLNDDEAELAQNASNYDHRLRYRMNMEASRTGNDDIVVYF